MVVENKNIKAIYTPELSTKIIQKHWIQNEIIQLELEGKSERFVELYKADLVRIENEIFDLTKES